MTVTTTSPTTTFVLDALRQNPEVTFAELKARAAVEGLTLQPLTYGRAKKELGLIAPRAVSAEREMDIEAAQEVQDMAVGSESAENGDPETAAETETVVARELRPEATESTTPPNSRPGSSAPASAAPRRRRVRAQASSIASPIEQLLAHMRRLEEENRRYREALEQIRAVVDGVQWTVWK